MSLTALPQAMGGERKPWAWDPRTLECEVGHRWSRCSAGPHRDAVAEISIVNVGGSRLAEAALHRRGETGRDTIEDPNAAKQGSRDGCKGEESPGVLVPRRAADII